VSKPQNQNIHEYLAELDDIPGTRIYTAARARKGYWINQFAMSLMKAENRDRFKANERAYLDEWNISEAAKEALLARDYNRLLDLGGNVYFLSKLFSSDGLPFAEAVSTMTDMTFPEYREMMMKGGRSPEGNRSIKANLAAAAANKGAN
jgi:protocatechuate 4,5-dioxygenase alpha chain